MAVAQEPTSLMPLAYHGAPPILLLCCPACGSEKQLREPEGLPAGVSRLITPCPDCEGHGASVSLLMFDDGRVECVTQWPSDQPATHGGSDVPHTRHALPLRGARRNRLRMQPGENIARG